MIPIEGQHGYNRLVALIASVFVSLVAGTPYLYGVYSPQLVKRIGLSTSDAATISLAVNMGGGLGGLPAGLIIDGYGPHKAIVLGSMSIFCGYFSLHEIYDKKVQSLLLVCLAMVFVGFGSVMSFFAGLKAAQANFPNNRGTAGALPVGAYGLAATLFSFVAAKAFKDNTGGLLRFLAIFCGSVAFCGSWFIHVYDDDSSFGEDAVILLEDDREAGKIIRRNSLRGSFSFWGIGTSLSRSSSVLLVSNMAPLLKVVRDQNQANLQSSGVSSLREAPLTPKLPNSENSTIEPSLKSTIDQQEGASQVVWFLLTNKTYLIHYIINALLSGIGQMYIYTVGFVITAQFHQKGWEGSPQALQAIQVSTISLCSFGGRVLSGILSDFIRKTLKGQRLWMILVTISFLGLAQYMLIATNSMTTITFVSMLIGTGYGLLNGTYPAIIADDFGTKNFSTAWGLICSGPLVVLFSLEKYFGYIYDLKADETGVCSLGNKCYKGAFVMSGVLCVLPLAITSARMYKKRNT